MGYQCIQLTRKWRFYCNNLIIVKQLADVSTRYSGRPQGSSEAGHLTESPASYLRIIKLLQKNLHFPYIVSTENDVAKHIRIQLITVKIL